MTNTANTAAETVTLRGVTYTITREIDPEDTDATPSIQLGWLTGPRGAQGMITRLQPSGVLMVMASPGSKLDRLPIHVVNDELSRFFN